MDLEKTMRYSPDMVTKESNRDILKEVYAALVEKGYNPTSQLVGFIQSGDPTYITNYKNARALISKVDRNELLKEMIRIYLGLGDE